MLSKSLTRSYYQSLYERCVRWAFELRKSAAKCEFPLATENLNEQANEYAKKATEALQAIDTLR